MVEVIVKRRWPLFALLGVIFLVSNIFSAIAYDRISTKPREIVYTPYKDVDIIRAEFDKDPDTDETWFYFYANFVKVECDIETFRVVSKYNHSGSFRVKGLEDLDGRMTNEELGLDNRSAGEQTMRLRFKVDPDFEWIEFRTSHLCPRDEEGAVRVPKLFTRVSGTPAS